MIGNLSEMLRRIGQSVAVGAVAAVLSVAAVVVGWSLPAEAATPAPAAVPTAVPTALSLSVAPSATSQGSLTLTSQVEGESSLSGHSVSFFVVSKEFGNPVNVPIGTATIGSAGTASVTYKPTWSGETQFVVKLPGASAKTTVTATSSYAVATYTPGPLYSGANPKRPLSAVGHVFVASALTLVALVWLTLITFLVLARWRLPQLAEGRRAD